MKEVTFIFIPELIMGIQINGINIDNEVKKNKLLNRRRYSLIIHLIRGQYKKYVRNS